MAEDVFAYFWRKIKAGFGSLWYFVLEAKDLTPQLPLNMKNVGVSKIRNVFKIRVKEDENDPDFLPEVTDTLESAPAEAAPSSKSPEKLYLEAIKKNPSNREAYEGLGRLYLHEKNFSEAAEVYRYLIKLDPAKDIYWSNLGLSLYSTKDFRSAVAAYDHALKINSKIPVRWINLALCFDALDEPVKAIKAVTTALTMDRRNIAYMSFLADLYMKVRNKVRAEEVLEQILQADPANKPAREKLMKLRV